MEKINVEEIMQQIRDDIKARGIEDKEALFESIPVPSGDMNSIYDKEAYDAMLENAGKSSEVQSYRPLLGNPIERFVKKVIRRLVAFYIESIVDDQNIFNKNVHGLLTMGYAKSIEDDENIELLEKKLYDCEKRIIELEKKISEISK